MAATDDPAKVELAQLFPNVGEHDDVMAECLSILRLYNLAPQDLYFKFEAFLLSRPSGLRAKLQVLTLDTARELRREIQRESQAKAVASAAATPSDKGNAGVRKKATDLGGFLDGLNTPVRPKAKSGAVPSRLSNSANNANLPSPGTPNSFATPQRPSPAAASSSAYRPTDRLAPPSSATPTGRTMQGAPSSPVSGAESPGIPSIRPTVPFSQRDSPHSLIETLNAHLPSSSGVHGSSRPRVALSTSTDPKDYDYRYMFEKISSRSEALDEQIDEFAETIRDVYGLNEMGDPHFATDDDIYTVGRILSPPTDSSKATSSSMYLESSRIIGGGRRIALRFASDVKVRGGPPGVKGFGLFPGCLTCVKGRNGGGGFFVVDEVLMVPPSGLPQSSTSELLAFQHGERLSGQPIGIHVAAGPYTLDDDLLFAPLDALVDVVLTERPDLVLLLGPFISDAHPLIASGNIMQSPIEIFRDRISSQLARIVEESPATIVILVPSVRDIVSRHVAFPQAALDRDALGLPKKIKVLPNPCTFSINEILISLTSLDVLFHLRKEEFFQRAEEAEPDPSAAPTKTHDSMASLVRHVLGQKSFYPLFPPPEALAGDVNLDVTHHHLIRMDGPAPDVLIIPSKLKHFSKVVDSTLVVNPSHLSRPHAAGTFAKMHVHPTPAEVLEGDAGDMDMDIGAEGMREHRIWERARSEIWRI